MISLFLFLIQQENSSSLRKSPLNSITHDCTIEEIKTNGRPIFIRVYYFTYSVSYAENLQWENAAEIFPQVDFVSVDCNYNFDICNRFYGTYYTPQYGYVKGNESTILTDTIFTFDVSDYNSPQKFVDIIYQYDNLYPIGPPILKLFPYTTDSFFSNTDHPIFLFYDSSRMSQIEFLNAWSKAANEEIYPEGDQFLVGLLDCNTYLDECLRWSNSTSISTPIAYIYSRDTGNYEMYNSYNFPIKNELIQSFMQNTDILPNRPTPTPHFTTPEYTPSPDHSDEYVNVTVEEGYYLLNNPYLAERTIDQVKAIYKEVYKPPSSPCQNGCGSTIEELFSCDQITPSKEDHQNALNLINVFRWLAGLSYLIEENVDWSSLSQDLALNVHKVGFIPTEYDMESTYSTSSYCGSSVTLDTYRKSLLVSEISDCFSSILEVFRNDYSGNLVNRRTLLKADLDIVGLGYYHQTTINDDDSTPKSSIGSIKVTELSTSLTYDPDVTVNLDFISWPPAGYFPIDQLPKNWHITHHNFHYVSITDLEIKVFRDDGFELPISSSFIDNNNNDQSTLILQMSERALNLCQLFRTITVSVKNTVNKEHIMYSFELFSSDSECIDACFYDDDEDKCPSKVNGRNRYGPGNYNQEFFARSTTAIRIYVAQQITLYSSIRITNTQKIIILGKTINGKIMLKKNANIDYEDPTGTDIVLEWDISTHAVGTMNSKKKPKSYSVEISDLIDPSNAITQKRLFSIGNAAPISLSTSIVRGPEYDVFYSFSFEEEECYINTFLMKSYDQFHDINVNFNIPSSSKQINDMTNLAEQKSNKRIIKGYSGSLAILINKDCFIKGNRKRDYEFYSTGGPFEFYCDYEFRDLASSIHFSFSPYAISSSIHNYYFRLYPVSTNLVYLRDRCEFDQITINDALFNKSKLYFPFVEGDDIATSNYPYKYVDIYSNSDSTSTIYAESDDPLSNCIVETNNDFNSYSIRIFTSNINEYESITIHPKKGCESSLTTIYLYNRYTQEIPNNRESMPSIYYENYENLIITNPLYYQYSYSSVLYTFHHYFNFSDCKNVRFQNQPNFYEDKITVKNPLYIIGGSDFSIDFGAFTLIEDLTFIKPGNYKLNNTQISRVYSSSNQRFIGVKIRNSITINSSKLILDNCILLDRIISINLVRTNYWPALVLIGTIFFPSRINIDLKINPSKLNLDDSSVYERHILISGFLNNSLNRCDSTIGKVSLNNQGNFRLFCSEDNTFMYVVKGSLEVIQNMPDDKSKKKLSGGAITGIFFGCLFGLAIIIGLIFCIIKECC